MNIYLIGDFSDDLDEGLKNIAHNFFMHLKEDNSVKILDIKNPFNISTIKTILTYEPDIIHYFTSPTISSFIILNVFHIKWPNCRTLLSALHPDSFIMHESKITKTMLKFISKPDAILYQGDPKYFKNLSHHLIYLANGVDTTKFRPVDIEIKKNLRKKYGIGEDKFVILHVGHLSEKRNLEIFKCLQRQNSIHQVIIAGSTYLEKDEELLTGLQNEGCKLFVGYVENIEELYALADCYVFGVLWGNTINIPLSILEAMACNLPVIALNYPTLSIFSDIKQLYLVDSVDDIPQKIDYIRDSNNKINIPQIRDTMLKYSWENIVKDLVQIYNRILGLGNKL